MGHFSYVGFGFAKALIFGEYAVMYGAPGLVTALSPRCTVRVYDLPTDTDGAVTADSDGTRDAAWERALREHLGIRACVSVARDGFFDADGHKLGIGSSAAVAVGIVDAVRQLPDAVRRQAQFLTPPGPLFATAIALHRETQGRMGSGIDVIASAMGGVVCARGCPHDPVVRRVAPECLPRIAVLATRRPAPTADFLAAARAAENTREYRTCIDALALAYADLERCLDAPTKKRDFLDRIGELPALLRRIGNAIGRPVVPPEFDAILPVARECGVVLKTSGAGGGDILLAMAEADDAIRDFCARLPEGIAPLPYPIAPERDLV